MAQFTILTSRVVPLLVNDIDTDQIIPARFLKVTDKTGLGSHLFADWRYNQDGSKKIDFPLNDPRHNGARFLLAGNNFGCGSSREHAPWALMDFGFQAIISTSFADIFRSNALKNGLLPVVVDEATHRDLGLRLRSTPDTTVTVDLQTQTLQLPEGGKTSFPIDGFSKSCLLNGVDELGYLLRFSRHISDFEAAHT